MKLIKKFIYTCFSIFVLNNFCYALPFNIFPKVALPTQVVQGQNVNALYTVQNNTGRALANNFIKYLPPNVTQVLINPAIPDLCNSRFNLAPKGAPSDSCTLSLSITGAVNSNDPIPQHHLFACLSAGATCAGTLFPLNVSVVQNENPNPNPPGPVTMPTLYGETDQSSSSPLTLFTLDTSTADATSIMGLPNGLVGAAIASDGLNLYHWAGNSIRIFERINLDTSDTTNIPISGANTGIVIGATYYASANAFRVTSVTNNYYNYTITGAATLIGPIAPVTNVRGLACFNA